jgi:SAM-dependent methyltransferase
MGTDVDLTIPPATARNAAPIRDVLARFLPAHLAPGAAVLDIASGVGHHSAVMAAALPLISWQPTEIDAAACAPIAARVAALGLPNLRPPLVLDTRARPWSVATADAVLCINMIHISPWDSTIALFAGAGDILPPGGWVITYGPYRFDGDFGAESNRTFDESLRARNPAWGLRDVREIATMAATHGFVHRETWPMPANNHMLAFRKS